MAPTPWSPGLPRAALGGVSRPLAHTLVIPFRVRDWDRKKPPLPALCYVVQGHTVCEGPPGFPPQHPPPRPRRLVEEWPWRVSARPGMLPSGPGRDRPPPRSGQGWAEPAAPSPGFPSPFSLLPSPPRCHSLLPPPPASPSPAPNHPLPSSYSLGYYKIHFPKAVTLSKLLPHSRISNGSSLPIKSIK